MGKQVENVIYILTNPQYPGYIKIGYATNLKQRLVSLNTGSLAEFVPYAVYETPLQNADRELHKVIELLNPILRASKFNNGKSKVKEFFKLEPEEAYELLEHIAAMTGTESRLYKVDRNCCPIKPAADRVPASDRQQAAQQTNSEKQAKFRFSMVGIATGEQLTYIKDPSIKVTVVDDTHISYKDKVYSMSGLVQELTHRESVQGTLWFAYNGVKLTELRAGKEME